MYKHGMDGTKIYRLWCHMRERCSYKKYKSYKNYGGRGIKVCEEWNNNFMSFYEWAMNNGYKEGLTLDRINVDGNYEPNNCRFITNIEQQRNKRNTKYITIKGITKSAGEWAEISNLNRHTIYYRYNAGLKDYDLVKPGRNGGGLTSGEYSRLC